MLEKVNVFGVQLTVTNEDAYRVITSLVDNFTLIKEQAMNKLVYLYFKSYITEEEFILLRRIFKDGT